MEILLGEQTKFTVIVAKFSILRVGGHYSDFKLVRARKATLELEIAEAPPSN